MKHLNPGVLVGAIGLVGLTAGVGITIGLAVLQGDPQLNQSLSEPPQPSPQFSKVSASVAPAATPAKPSAAVLLSQAENDYLYDLSQALQKSEFRRATQAEQMTIGRQICGWLEDGADFWQVRSQFDQQYRGILSGDYAFNRDAYLKFAAERLCPPYAAIAGVQPPQVIVETQTIREEVPVYIREKEQVPVPQPYPVPVPVIPRPHPIPHPPHPIPHPPHPVPPPKPIPLPSPQPPLPPIPLPTPTSSPQPSPTPPPIPLPDPIPDPTPDPQPEATPEPIPDPPPDPILPPTPPLPLGQGI